MKRTLRALLSATLAIAAGVDAQILPFGEFQGRTGRPGPGKTWKVSDATGSAIAARLNARHAEGRARFNFDYEHQAFSAPTNGQPAPASGWASRFEWRPGVGLFALQVDWTPRAKAYIDGKEYAYLSPVILFDPDTGEVTDVLMASLTNYPDLMQLPGVDQQLAQLNALPTSTPENDMELLNLLLAQLGLPATTDQAAALSAVKALKEKADAAAALPAIPVALCGALGLTGTVDEAAALSAVNAMKAKAAGTDPTTMAAMTALQGQVAALSAAQTLTTVTNLVDQALKDGKLLPAQRDWAMNLGKADLAQLTAFVKDAPKVAAGLAGTQSEGKDPADKGAKVALTGEQLAMCTALGLTPEQFQAGAIAAA